MTLTSPGSGPTDKSLVLRVVPPFGRAGAVHTLMLEVSGKAHHTCVCGRGMGRGSGGETPMRSCLAKGEGT